MVVLSASYEYFLLMLDKYPWISIQKLYNSTEEQLELDLKTRKIKWKVTIHVS